MVGSFTVAVQSGNNQSKGEYMNIKQATVEAARTQEEVENHQCGYVFTFDTLGEAKREARYCLTDDFARSGELVRPFGYARVMVGDECVADYFRK